MRRGASLYEGTFHTDGSGLLAAVDAWAAEAGGYPKFVPLWCQLTNTGPMPAGSDFDATLMNGLLTRGVEPMVFMTSSGWVDAQHSAPQRTYQSYLAGDYDSQLDAWSSAAADYGHRLIVRWDHEMGMAWAPWSVNSAPTYKSVFSHVADRLRAAGNVKLWFCGGGRQKLLTYFPGGTTCDYIGFDKYSRDEAWDPLPTAWKKSIDTCKSLSGHPIIVGEFGREASLSQRWQWLKTIRDVQDVWLALYFDMDLTAEEDVDWTMTKYMRQRYLT